MLPLLLLTLACGYQSDKFAEDMATATCTLYRDCEYLDSFGFASFDACVTTVQASYDPDTIDCPAYDGKASAECVDGVDAMTCDDLYAGAWPQACTSRCGFTGDGSLGDDTGG